MYQPGEVEVMALLPDGSLKARWRGTVLCREGGFYAVATHWQLHRVERAGLHFEPQDRLVEYFHQKQWFNLFAIWDPSTQRQRGWYVNVATPVAEVCRGEEKVLTYTDLALDFVVTPQGVTEMDRGEYEALLVKLPVASRTDVSRTVARLRENLFAGTPGDAWRYLQRHVEAAALPVGGLALPSLIARFGFPVAAEETLDWQGNLEGWRRLQRQGQRVAEAIYVLRLPGGRTLLHTKEMYPAGAFRLPGGGIADNEDPAAAAVREADEETGIKTTPVALLAYGHFRLKEPGTEALKMPNYVFLLDPLEPNPDPHPSSEERIAAFRAVAWRDLPAVARQLSQLPGAWASWGRYRAIPHHLAATAIQAGSWAW